MTFHGVRLSGCDDSTEITIEMTEDELAFSKRLAAALSDASSYGCMPRMYIDENYRDES